MLDLNALRSYCEGFYGYGELEAPHWFISMEEGGGTSEKEIATRIEAWITRGCHELEDLKEYHQAIKIDKWFRVHPPIQKTWYATIRMLLILDGQLPSPALAQDFQRDSLAQFGGNSRLSPLFPLPSKSLDDWKYAAWTDAPTFDNRFSYRKNFEQMRVSHLASGISRARPRTVVFYGQSYRDYWHQISSIKFKPHSDGFEIGNTVETCFIICRHPAAQGVTNAYFDSIGRLLAAA